MDILTLELFDVTVSSALKEINRAVEDHPTLPLRILLGGDPMLHHNILRFLERLGRAPRLRAEGSRWRIDATGLAARPSPPAPVTPIFFQPPVASVPFLTPEAAPAAAVRQPLLLTRAAMGQGLAATGRRVLLGVLRELDPSVPWVCLALEALELLDDPQALKVLEALQARGIAVRISRESQLFPTGDSPFEIMEDSQWQRLAGRGEIVIL